MLGKLMAKAFLKVMGWKVEGEAPAAAKCVLVLAPHTSNWDFFFMLATANALGVHGRWFGKDAIFKGPFGWFARKLGGMPVDRRAPHGLVKEVARHFAAHERLVVAVQPEGTRSYASHWKSGFYQIAVEAGVPIATLSLDFAKRRGGFGPCFHPTGDRAADMDILRAYYADKTARWPEKVGPIRLEDESAEPLARAA